MNGEDHDVSRPPSFTPEDARVLRCIVLWLSVVVVALLTIVPVFDLMPQSAIMDSVYMSGVLIFRGAPRAYFAWERCTEIAFVVAVMGHLGLAIDWARHTGYSLLLAITYGATAMCMIGAVINRSLYGDPHGYLGEEMLPDIGAGLVIVLVALHCVERVLARRFRALAHCEWDLLAKRVRELWRDSVADSGDCRPLESKVVANARSRLSPALLDRTVAQGGVNTSAARTDGAGRIGDPSIYSVRFLEVLRYLLLFVAFGALVDLGFGSAFDNWRGPEFEYCMSASRVGGSNMADHFSEHRITFDYDLRDSETPGQRTLAF